MRGISCLGFGVCGLGLGIWDSWFGVSGYVFEGEYFYFQGVMVWGSWFGVWSFGFKIGGLKFGFWGSPEGLYSAD